MASALRVRGAEYADGERGGEQVIWSQCSHFVLIAALVAEAAPAAVIEVKNWNGLDVVSLTGPIESGDFTQLIEALSIVEPLPHGYRVVLLDSPGGSVSESLAISEVLKSLDVHTVVPNGARCASACGSIVFVGGVVRTVEHFGLLGQHSCSRDGVADETCNEVISQHAMRNGVSHGSISAFVTYVPPDEIIWFSREDVDGWGISLYPGSIEVGFEKSEPRAIQLILGAKPLAQAIWRLDFRKDGFEAFLRPASDDERELELNLFCDETLPGRLFLSMEILGPANIVSDVLQRGVVETDIFSWIEDDPYVHQYDALASEVVLEVPKAHIIELLTKVNEISVLFSVEPPYDPIGAHTFLAESRENLIFAANNCVNRIQARR